MSRALVWLRREVLPLLLEDKEETILFWLGKQIAKKERLRDFISLRTFFKQNELGELLIKERRKDGILLRLEKHPLIEAKESETERFALECGIMTYTMEELFQRKGNGDVIFTKSEEGNPVLHFQFLFLE